MSVKKKLTSGPSVAVVLSGGGVKGISHLGVLKVLQDSSIPIDLIVGASAGAILGAAYSDTQNAELTYKIAGKMWPQYYDYNILGLPSLTDGVAGHGFFSIKGIRNTLAKVFRHKKIEELPIPTRLVATQFPTGKLHVFSSGCLLDAICASSSIPILFQAFSIGRNKYIDGGILSDLPVTVARKLGATIVIACNVAMVVKRDEEKGSMWYDTWAIIQNKTRAEEAKKADIVVQPNIANFPRLLASKEELDGLYEAGKQAAKGLIPKIKKIIREKSD